MTIDAANQHPASDAKLSTPATQVLWCDMHAFTPYERISKQARKYFRENYGATFVFAERDLLRYLLLAPRSERIRTPSDDLVRAAVCRLRLPDEAAITARGVITYTEHCPVQISIHKGQLTPDEKAFLIRQALRS